MLRPALSLCLTIALGVTEGANAFAAASPSPTFAPAISPSPALDPVDQLSETDLQRALDYVKKNYVAPGALTDAQMNRAALAGLCDRLGRGVILRRAHPANEAAIAPLFHDVIAEHIGYLRPGGLRKSDLADLDNALKNFAAKKVDALMLDLRGVSESDDFAAAAEFAKRFVPRAQSIFELRSSQPNEKRDFVSDRSPAYAGVLLALIDEETAGPAEILARSLRARARAILIGEKTAGAAFAYEMLALPNELTLRVATMEAVLPEDHSSAASSGALPDLPVAMSAAAKHEIFQQSLSKGMNEFIFETDRPHLNEAALLAGTNPEIEATQQRRARGEKTPLHDPVAQRALDVITSIGVYEKPAAHAP